MIHDTTACNDSLVANCRLDQMIYQASPPVLLRLFRLIGTKTCAFQRAFKGRGVAGGVNVQQLQKIVKLNSRYDDRVRKFLLGHPARVSNAFSEDDRFIKSESFYTPIFRKSSRTTFSHNLYR